MREHTVTDSCSEARHEEPVHESTNAPPENQHSSLYSSPEAELDHSYEENGGFRNFWGL